MIEWKLEDLNIGMKASNSKLVTDADITHFADISGDYNPIHIDSQYAEQSQFGKKIAHGMMSSSLFSGIFGTQLPGKGCLYISQNLKFKKPIFINDYVVATVEIKKICFRTRKITFVTTCEVEESVVIQGIAEIYLPNK